MDLPILYSRDSKGKARQWEVFTDGPRVVVRHGTVGGKLTEKAITCKPKNVGKANATTAETQAEAEAKAKWVFQVDREDYNVDIDQANRQVRPMLALDYLKVPKRVRWDDAVAQPKLDGLRLTVGSRYRDDTSTFVMMTRKGETYDLAHLDLACKRLLEIAQTLAPGCICLDGEAYKHGLPLQTITSYARRYQKGLTEQLEFHLFDLIIPDMAFIERYAVLVKAVDQWRNECGSAGSRHLIEVVPLTLNVKPSNLDTIQGEFMENGYEGVMIRHASSKYEIAARSAGLFKYKKFYDDEFKIVGMWEDDNGNAMLECIIPEGKKLSCDDYVATHDIRFDCTPKRPFDFRKEMLNNRDEWIGKWITVKYQALTIDKSLQFPVGLALRECDDEGNPIV